MSVRYPAGLSSRELAMRELTGNIWDLHDSGHWIVITTNGNVKVNGEAVMGRGIALQAKKKYPALPQDLGKALMFRSNKLWSWPEYRIITFPTKHNWRDRSDLQLIEKSCQELVGWLEAVKDFYADQLRMKIEDGKTHLYMVRPGCSNGGLDWADVKPVLERYLDDRFVVVERDR